MLKFETNAEDVSLCSAYGYKDKSQQKGRSHFIGTPFIIANFFVKHVI